MFTTSIKIRDGFARWADSLPAIFKRGRKTDPNKPAPVDRPPPQTEGERALHQAMGWSDNAWEE